MLLDNLLGDGSGVEFLEFATKLISEKGGNMPIVVSMSGNPVGEQKQMYQTYQVNGFLQKQIKRQDLIDLMKID